MRSPIWPLPINNDPQSIRDADYDHLRQLGLDDHLILEALSIAAFIGATNRLGIALAVPPNPEYTGVPRTRDAFGTNGARIVLRCGEHR